MVSYLSFAALHKNKSELQQTHCYHYYYVWCKLDARDICTTDLSKPVKTGSASDSKQAPGAAGSKEEVKAYSHSYKEKKHL